MRTGFWLVDYLSTFAAHSGKRCNAGCSSARLEYSSGGRVVAGSNPVTPTNWKASQSQHSSCFEGLFYGHERGGAAPLRRAVFGYYGVLLCRSNRQIIDQRRTDNYREAVIRKSLFEERGADTSIHCWFASKEAMFHEWGVFRHRLSRGRKNHATLQTSAEGREKSVSLHQENSLFLRSATFFRIMKARR